jgi:molybdopterin/thiamine biosynthesis adenylyltransferase
MSEVLYTRQKTLKLDTDQSATIVGCGGIGYWVAKFLAMAGVEKLFVYDMDVIEEHNLNRLDLPHRFIGRNKADIVKIVIETLRPECTVYAFPYKFNEDHDTGTDWLIDCTDKYEAQITNQKIANDQNMRYVKAGYDGEDFSINNSVAEWGDAEDGYVTIPSFVVPAVMIAAMTVAKILKYKSAELHSNIKGVFTANRVK